MARHGDLAPTCLHQRVNGSPVHVLLEARPSDRGSAHGAALGVGVECQVMPCFQGLCRRKAKLAREDGSAVVYCSNFTVASWVASGAVVVCTNADKIPKSGLACVIHDCCPEGSEWTG